MPHRFFPVDQDADPGVARGLYRVGVFLACVAGVAYFFWELYSTTAAMQRLKAAAANFPYGQTCDANGNMITEGQPNCVDLGRYVFINGPTLTAVRRACSPDDEPPAFLVLEEGKAPRKDIVRIEKSLSFHKRNGRSITCNVLDSGS